MANPLFPSLYFHHVALNVSNYDEVVAFYKALGMRIYFEWETPSALDPVKVEKHCFIDIGTGPCIEVHTDYSQDNTSHKLPHFCFHVDDVDRAYEIALAHGAITIDAPKDFTLYGNHAPIPCRVCHVYAPGGEDIEFLNWFGYDPSLSSNQ